MTCVRGGLGLVLVLGFGVVACSAKPSGGASASQVTTSSITMPTTTTTTSGTTSTTTTAPYKPYPSDFVLGIIELDRSCFGSAGCNVGYRIEPAYTGGIPADPAKTFTVIYEIRGGDSPKTGNFTIRGTQGHVTPREWIGTPPNATLKAVVTRILES